MTLPAGTDFKVLLLPSGIGRVLVEGGEFVYLGDDKSQKSALIGSNK